jgi:hypothetical protein
MAGIRSAGVTIARMVAPLSVVSNAPKFASDTLSLKRKMAAQGSIQRWEISTRLEPAVGDASLMVHMIINDSDQIFDVEMPQVYRPSNASNGTNAPSNLSASNSPAIGSSSVTVTNNSGTRVAAGEFITFANHTKVYMVTALRTGNGSMTFYPPLMADVPSGTVINTGPVNVVMKARYDLDVVKGMIYTDGILQDMGTVRLIEAL